jgi:AraC-like DNA-binding protein
MEWLMEHCISECESHEFGAGPNALHYAEILSVMLEREMAVFGLRPKEQPVLKRLEKLWVRVLKDPGEKWNVDLLSAAAGCSSRELHRLCASLYGIGPMGLVTRMRMDRAMELLLSTQRKMDDISCEVGYSTAHSFSEAFLAHVGTRPGAFRDAGRDPRTPISKPIPS